MWQFIVISSCRETVSYLGSSFNQMWKKKKWKWLLRIWGYSYYAMQYTYLLEEDKFLLLKHSSFFHIQCVRPQDGMEKRYFRLPPWCSWGLCSSGMSRGIGRYLVIDVSGWPISPLDFLSPEDGTDRLSWNVGNRLSRLVSQKSEGLYRRMKSRPEISAVE